MLSDPLAGCEGQLARINFSLRLTRCDCATFLISTNRLRWPV